MSTSFSEEVLRLSELDAFVDIRDTIEAAWKSVDGAIPLIGASCGMLRKKDGFWKVCLDNGMPENHPESRAVEAIGRTLPRALAIAALRMAGQACPNDVRDGARGVTGSTPDCNSGSLGSTPSRSTKDDVVRCSSCGEQMVYRGPSAEQWCSRVCQVEWNGR